VECRALVAVTVHASAELTEIASGLGDNIVEEVEDDAAGLHCRKGQSSLCMEDSLMALQKSRSVGNEELDGKALPRNNRMGLASKHACQRLLPIKLKQT